MASYEDERRLSEAARALDQSSPETIFSKLQELWSALAATTPTVNNPAARFHASEEVALRWLLKNMYAASGKASTDVEVLRRWQLTWHIITVLFRRIPLFSLAKSLADRRFVAILQQTARDVATPTTLPATDSETDEWDVPHTKRKLTPVVDYRLESLGTPQECLNTGSRLFEALAQLLERLNTSTASSTLPYDRMGAEHVKSLFSVPASDAMTLLVPLLKLCKLTVTVRDGYYEGDLDFELPTIEGILESTQRSWMSTLSTLWDFHLQGPTDAFEVASHLSLDGLYMVGRLKDKIYYNNLYHNFNTQNESIWLADLQRFFTNNLMLPARSAFLNRNDLQPLTAAIAHGASFTDVLSASSLYSAIFYLAVKSPRPLAGGGSSSKDNERWLQTVFEKVLEAIVSSKTLAKTSDKARLLMDLLRMANKNGVSPSISSLRKVYQTCAFYDRKELFTQQQQAPSSPPQLEPDWNLLSLVANCDIDVFLLADGSDLLDDILRQAGLVMTTYAYDSTLNTVVDLVTSLAKGFSSSRNLPGFIMRWYDGIVGLGAKVLSPIATHNVWLDRRLRSVVANLLQSSLTKDQFLSVISQIVARGDDQSQGDAATANSVARLVIFDTISTGIHLEEIEDAVQTKLLDGVDAVDLSPQLSPDIVALRWCLIRRTLAWVGFADAERIWTTVKRPLMHIISTENTDSILTNDKFEAFCCCFSLWMALKFGGLVEQEAKDMTWGFLQKLHAELPTVVKTKKEQLLLVQNAVDKANIVPNASFVIQTNGPKTECMARYIGWMFGGSSRFLDEMVKSSSESFDYVQSLVSWQPGLKQEVVFEGIPRYIAHLVNNNYTTLQNHTIVSCTTEIAVKGLEDAVGKKEDIFKIAVQGLLATPSYLLSRSQRERVVAALIPRRRKTKSPRTAMSEEVLGMVLDLLVSTTQERAFADLAFDRLAYFGETIDALLVKERAGFDVWYGFFRRFSRVATAYFRSASGKKKCANPSSLTVTVEVVFAEARLVALQDSLPSDPGSGQLEEAKETLASLLFKQLKLYLDMATAEEIAAKKKAWDTRIESKAADMDFEHEYYYNNNAKRDSDDEDCDSDDENVHPAIYYAKHDPRKPYMLPPALWLALDAAMSIDIGPQLARQNDFTIVMEELKMKGLEAHLYIPKVAWKWKAFISRYGRGQELCPPREVCFKQLFPGVWTNHDPFYNPAPDAIASLSELDSILLKNYLDSETVDYDHAAILSYIDDIIDALSVPSRERTNAIGQLLAIQYLLVRLFETNGGATAKTADGSFHLGIIHSKLVQQLPKARSITECKLLAQTLHTLLVDDKAATAMGQWNVDSTMSSAALLVGFGSIPEAEAVEAAWKTQYVNSIDAVRKSTTAFDGACQLVEAVLKRHRVRLEGRFHLVVSTLQALLTRLAAGHQEGLKKTKPKARVDLYSPEPRETEIRALDFLPAPATDWASQAKRFSRLLELICEPSAAAVTMMRGRKGAGGAPAPLHSATDAAKRSAGQHMYFVLMTYIKLQIDGAIFSRDVREALEPGLYSILSITSEEARRVLNDAVDASGRALFKDLYRKWLQFWQVEGRITQIRARASSF